MKQDQGQDKVFNRRAAILAAGQITVFAGLSARMYYLQVLEADRYRVLAEENRISLRLLPPPRGIIFDRREMPLAVNVQTYRLVIVPEQAKNVGEMLTRLSRLVDVGEHERRRVLREVRRRRAFVPITVRENLSWEEVSRIEVNAPDLPGITIDVAQSRHYPYSDVAAHVIGYVAAVSEKELTGDPVLELPGFRIGKNGIERRYDLELRGRAGNTEVEVNALGRVIREIDRQEGQPGLKILLTLDIGLQKFIAERIAGQRRASVVVMDVQNGEVLGMVSRPGFDPNAFNKGMKVGEWKKLIGNPDKPLTNKAIAGQYAPGSVFKIVVALAALEKGIRPDMSVHCEEVLEFGNELFHCWKKDGHGDMDLIDALRESCDIYFYELAQQLGINRIARMAKRFGLGEVLNLELPGERPGLIPTKKWKRKALRAHWLGGESLINAIGQGYVLTTPLQLAVMTARVVNGGYAVVPRLTKLAEDADDPPQKASDFPSIGLSQRSMKLVLQALDEVVNNPAGGTAYRARIAEQKWQMGGKTGTSQVRRITLQEREDGVKKNEERPWRERDHALFVGYAPVESPRYACAVVVEHGGGGAKTAAPIARDVLRETQRLDPAGIRPKKVARKNG
ncbi:MAG TPA: penicillin-binding protein 2 [Rhodospirillaceae bacterium]|nr:penicillin-binding protein 2 [Rhodospirillaceae bacterium]HAT36850.1 penicillin-binding protein 2 [Rhodospirillaceae bacterium]